MNIYERYDLEYNKKNNNIIKINKEYDLVYDKKYNEIALYRNKEECLWYLNKGTIYSLYIHKNLIHNIYEIDLEELINIKDNIIIKYIIEIDKLNKENKLKKKDIKEIYNNLKYIIENNKE